MIASQSPSGQKTTIQHNLQLHQEVVTDALQNATTFTYDAFGNVTNTSGILSGPGGHPITASATYTDASNPTKLTSRTITLADGTQLTTGFNYDASGNLQLASDPLGRAATFKYDGLGHVLTVTNRDQNVLGTPSSAPVRSNTYDPVTGLLIHTEDAYHNPIDYAYYPSGQQKWVRNSAQIYTWSIYYGGNDPNGRPGDLKCSYRTQMDGVTVVGPVTTYKYDAAGNKVEEDVEVRLFDQNGASSGATQTLVTTYQYDSSDRLLQTIYPDGTHTQTLYDASGRIDHTVDKIGLQTYYEYDADGRMIRTTQKDNSGNFLRDAGGNILQCLTSYDLDGRVQSQTDINGRTSQFIYDSLGRVVQTINPDGSRRSVVYDDAGRPVARTDENNHTTISVYDLADHVAQTIDPMFGSTYYTYDADGNRIAARDANGNIITYDYDLLGRLTRTHYPATPHVLLNGTMVTGETVADIVYDAIGRPYKQTAIYDPLDAGTPPTTSFAYDSLDRLSSVTDPAGSVTRYAYDDQGHKVQQIDSKSRITSFQYDSIGRLISRKLPGATGNNQVETRDYDSLGRLWHTYDFRGITTTYYYDAITGRLITKASNDSFGTTISYTYNPDGSQSTSTRSAGSVSFATSYGYDARGRLNYVSNPIGTLSYTFDPVGNKLSMGSLANPNPTTYRYDASNRLSVLTNPDGGQVQYLYDKVGNLTGTNMQGGISVRYLYDGLGRLTDVVNFGTVNGLSHRYTYNSNGRKRSAIDVSAEMIGSPVVPNGTVQGYTNYSYDLLGHLLSEYQYDSSNSIKSSITYTYDSVGNRTSTVATTGQGTQSVVYDYDGSGGVLSNDRLIDTRDAVTNTITQTFSYDANGNQTTIHGNSAVYDVENRLITYNGQGGNPPIATYFYDAAGNRISKASGGGTSYYLFDPTSQYAQVVEEYSALNQNPPLVRYDFGMGLQDVVMNGSGLFSNGTYSSIKDGFGNVRSLNNGGTYLPYDFDAFGNYINSIPPSLNEFGYTGQQYDSTLGLYYLRARYYDTGLGRLTSIDPEAGDKTDPQTLNKYTYAGSDPVNNSDPSGMVETTLNSEVVSDSIIAYCDTQSLGTTVNTGVIASAQITGTATSFLASIPISIYTVGGVAVLTTMAFNWLRNADIVGQLEHRLEAYAGTSNDSNNDNDQEDKKNRPQYFFRGTTPGWSGRFDDTSFVSTDPGVATIFGTNCQTQYGEGVILIFSRQDLAEFEMSPSLAGEAGVIPGEREWIVFAAASALDAKASIRVTPLRARQILSQLGIDVPSRIGNKTDLSAAIAALQHCTPDQVISFVDMARSVP